MNYFQLRELEITGLNLKSARLVFKPGLNVISGASDTGKSYVVECLYYIFGGRNPPKAIEESIGYTRIKLTIEFKDKIQMSIERDLSGGDYKVDIIESGSVTSTKLLAEDAFNKLIFERLKFGEVKLKTNASNETKRLTLTHLKQFTMINETVIVSKGSPITAEQYTDRTTNESCFTYMLSGIDDSALIKAPVKKEEEAKYYAGIEIINELISTIEPKIPKDCSRSELDEQLKKLEIEFQNRISAIEKMNSEADILTKKKIQARDKIHSIEIKIKNLKEIDMRFNLLGDSYKSDLERLKFLEEGNHLFVQMKPTTCPVCGQTFSKVHEHLLDINFNEIQHSIIIESEKIRELESDLEVAKGDLRKDILNVSEERRFLLSEVVSIEGIISGVLKTQISEANNSLNTISKKREELLSLLGFLNEMEKYVEIRTKVESQKYVAPKKEKGIVTKLDTYIYKFHPFMAEVLKAWKFSKKPHVEFNHKERDFIIDGKLRSSHGKGIRAVLYAAFSTSLLEYCAINEKPHLGFLLLDSPLTTHKEADKAIAPGDEAPEEGIQDSFFLDLSVRFKNRQVVIFENKEPPKSLSGKINHIHYSKIPGRDDYGFFPKV